MVWTSARKKFAAQTGIAATINQTKNEIDKY